MTGRRSRWHERQVVAGVELYPVEARLVCRLLESAGQPVPHAVLMQHVWPDRSDLDRRDRQHLRELVYRIRGAFHDETGAVPIATILGRGYMWERT